MSNLLCGAHDEELDRCRDDSYALFLKMIAIAAILTAGICGVSIPLVGKKRRFLTLCRHQSLCRWGDPCHWLCTHVTRCHISINRLLPTEISMVKVSVFWIHRNDGCIGYIAGRFCWESIFLKETGKAKPKCSG